MRSSITFHSAMASDDSARRPAWHGLSFPRIAWTRGRRLMALGLAWLVAASAVALAIERQNSRSERSHSLSSGTFLSSAAGGAPSVALAAPQRVTGPTTLRARARANSGRVVAVTFLLDGAPLGSDTIAPYTFSLDPALVTQGHHRLRVAAVDSLGRRRTTSAKVVTTKSYRSKALRATPDDG